MIILDEYGGFEFDKMYYSNDYFIDLLRLQKQLLEQEEIIASIGECVNIWQNYSWSVQASWLDMPTKGEDIIRYIKSADDFISFEEYSKM